MKYIMPRVDLAEVMQPLTTRFVKTQGAKDDSKQF